MTDNEELKFKSISPSIQQMVWSDIGRYASIHTGLDSYYYLMSVIQQLSSHLIVNYGAEWFEEAMNEEISKYKDYIRVDSWKDLDRKFQRMMPDINRLKIEYDNLVTQKDKNAIVGLRKRTRSIALYQKEIFFVFNSLMKLTGEHRRTIPTQYFKSNELLKFKEDSFDQSKNRGEV